MSEPLTPEQALGVALSVAAPTTSMGDAQAAAPDMLAHLNAMGYTVATLANPAGGVFWDETAHEVTRATPATWIDLAADIRAVDGNHDLGAGSLAHALIRRGWTRATEDAG